MKKPMGRMIEYGTFAVAILNLMSLFGAVALQSEWLVKVWFFSYPFAFAGVIYGSVGKGK